MFWPLLLYIQAGAYARSGRPAEGLGLIADAIETAGSEPTVLPELYLLKGDLLLAVESGSAAESWSSGRSTFQDQLRAALASTCCELMTWAMKPEPDRSA